ncbi:MAG: ACP S-malonyltransferase [Holosporales bacterium]|jgi:[acyl-carrier-protein] S-malonyltransferase|nr:ACP S-malonyltransferase [Holosporales bacterium]
MASALIFPGQGSQRVGMAAALVNGYKSGMDIMEEVEDAISCNLLKLISEGPLEELTRTENAQPAIFAVSMACINILEKEYGYILCRECKYLAGHSLGEYSALCAAGVFTIQEAARLVRFRGKLMEQAFPEKENCLMMALLGVHASDIEKIVKPYQDGIDMCVIANDNSPSQVVVSGTKRAVLEVLEKAKNSTELVNAIALNTSGPFHSPLMGKAAIEFDKMLGSIEFKEFNIPVIMNVLAKPVGNKVDIHQHLVRQMIEKVRWRETIDFITADSEIDWIVEIAPGKVLSTMLKRANPGVNVCNLETVAQIEEFVKAE